MRLLGALGLLWMGCVTAMLWLVHLRANRHERRIETLEREEGISVNSRDGWQVPPNMSRAPAPANERLSRIKRWWLNRGKKR